MKEPTFLIKKYVLFGIRIEKLGFSILKKKNFYPNPSFTSKTRIFDRNARFFDQRSRIVSKY